MFTSAISHHADGRDSFCLQPDHFLFRLRCGKGDLARVILHYQDKYLPFKIQDTRASLAMRKAGADNELDCWEAELSLHLICLRYWFELIDTEGKRLIYSNYHFSQDPPVDIEDMFDCPQNMREEERVIIPDWAAHKTVYQIFPSRFASSRPVSDRKWYKAPISFRDDLGGDLKGITAHLDHMKELGVDILYLTPVFYSHSCHKYDTIDYYSIDPSFGTEDDLKELVERAHALGLKVILDGVFNHTSPEFFAFADIREKGYASPYLDWYFIEGYPLRAAYGEKPNFKTFGYYGGMPKLNVANPQVTRFILDVALYWLRKCGIDGWRLDVGDEIGHAFWKTFRREIKSEFPQALIIGEIWHYAPDFLLGDEWDTVMNYPFYRALLGLIVTESLSPSSYLGQINYLRNRLHPATFSLLWNLIDSHDTPRILHECRGDKKRMKLAAALQLLSPGMPMIYYGDEFGLNGGKDPDCRRGMLWDPARQDHDMYAWYQRLLSIRKEYSDIWDQYLDEADDERRLLIRWTSPLTMIFHCGSGSVEIPAFKDAADLLGGSYCTGAIGPYGVMVFRNGQGDNARK